MPPPSLTLRSVKGAVLTAIEEENNHLRHEQRIDEVIANPPQPDEIASITAVGGTVTVAMESGALHTYSQPRSAPASPVRDPAVTADTFTPALADAGHFIRFSHGGGCVVTIPPESAVAFAVREEMHFLADPGPVTVVPGSGVTFVSVPGYEYETAQQGATITVKKIGSDLWLIFGWLKIEESTA